MTDDLVARAVDYTVALVQPDGEFSRIGDCTAAVVPHDSLESVLEMRRDVRRELALSDQLPPLSQYFPCSRQVMLRDGWGPKSVYLTMEATPCLAYHWHPARNAVQVHAYGRRLIADPGRMSYRQTPQRAYACTTRSHSTVNLNGWDQSPAQASMQFRSTAGYDVVAGLYDGGYWPRRDMEHGSGIFAEHHRTLLWVRGRCIIVIDHVYNTSGTEEKPDVEANWQFDCGCLSLDEGNSRAVFTTGRAGLLLVAALAPAGTSMSVHEGERDPCAGWIADRGDRPVPAPLLRLRTEGHDPWNADMVTVLVPFEGAPPDVRVRDVVDPSSGTFGRVALEWGDGTVDEVWWVRRMRFALGDVGDIRTDAGLVHALRDEAGRITRALVHDGSYLDPVQPSWRAERATYVVVPG